MPESTRTADERLSYAGRLGHSDPMAHRPDIVPDTEHRSLLGRMPARVRDLAQLARFDRPIGAWLLFWPGAWAIALSGNAVSRWDLLLWFLLGAIAMRGAGCVYNDIIDRDLDRQVARTRSRPLASGAVSLKAAWIWLGALCLIGLVVLLQLNPVAAGHPTNAAHEKTMPSQACGHHVIRFMKG